MLQFIKRFRVPIVIGAAGVAVVAFLLFRPDKLFVDDRVDESLDDAFGSPTTTLPAPSTTTSIAAPPETSGGTTSTQAPTTTLPLTTTTTVPSGPVVVSEGPISGIDHDASGTSTVYELGGDFVLRLEDDTDIQNGPDLYVWMLPGDSYTGGIPSDFINLGKLKGNVGGQNYELPAEFDPDIHRTMLIWCERFDVPFATAPMA